MPSTRPAADLPVAEMMDWRVAGLRHFAYSFYLRRKYGGRVQRISLDAGLTCPNVDGTIAVGGCVFCDNRSFSPSRRLPRMPIRQQLEFGIQRVRRRYACDRFIAYFQPASNTYAPVERLRACYEEAIAHPQVVALAIGTRADCVPGDVLDLLQEIAGCREVSVEYGLQTIHDRSLVWMNRGHDHAAFLDAVQRSRGRGFSLGAHVILGLPGETPQDMLATARELARLDLDSVKLHNLYAVRGTPLADQLSRGEFQLLALESYVPLVADVLEILPPRMVVERLSGDAPPEHLIAPAWCRDKVAVRAAILAELERRDSWQGRYWTPEARAGYRP